MILRPLLRLYDSIVDAALKLIEGSTHFCMLESLEVESLGHGGSRDGVRSESRQKHTLLHSCITICIKK